MKGLLTKLQDKWFVKYERYAGEDLIRLHPDNVKEIEDDSKIFDNIEARIASHPEVEFEIQTIAIGNNEFDVIDCDVAKLIKN